MHRIALGNQIPRTIAKNAKAIPGKNKTSEQEVYQGEPVLRFDRGLSTRGASSGKEGDKSAVCSASDQKYRPQVKSHRSAGV